MAKYRLLTKEGYPDDFFVKGKIYHGDDRKSRFSDSISELSKCYYRDWERIDTIEIDITAALQAGVQQKEIEMRLNLALMQLVAEKTETFNLDERG